MTLLDEVRAERTLPPSCTAGKFLAGLPDDERAEVLEVMALSNDEVASTVLTRVLRRRYDKVPNSSTIQRHRAGRCACE